MAMIAPQDTAFLMLESREHPMHVGGLQVFKLPDGAKRDFVGQLYEESLKFTELRPLFTRYAKERLASERFGDWVARVLWTEQPAAAN